MIDKEDICSYICATGLKNMMTEKMLISAC